VSEKERFEAWARGTNLLLRRVDEFGSYHSYYYEATEIAWEAWQAAQASIRDAVLEEAANILQSEIDSGYDEQNDFNDGATFALSKLRNAIRALKDKP
jgi:hypothetical protein